MGIHVLVYKRKQEQKEKKQNRKKRDRIKKGQ